MPLTRRRSLEKRDAGRDRGARSVLIEAVRRALSTIFAPILIRPLNAQFVAAEADSCSDRPRDMGRVHVHMVLQYGIIIFSFLKEKIISDNFIL